MQKTKSSIHLILLFLFWLIARPLAKYLSGAKVRSDTIILVTSEVHTLIGARGDEAMTRAIIAELTDAASNVQIYVSTATSVAADSARAMGLVPFNVWSGVRMPFAFLGDLRRLRPSRGVLVGADVMDGYYSPVESLRRVIAADLLAKSGASTAFTGFSMNDSPSPWLRRAFRMLDKGVAINLRDPLSHKRFETFTGVRAHEVADVAFLLNPSGAADACRSAVEWVEQERHSGRCVIALNFHPMLFDVPARKAGVARLQKALVACMQRATSAHSVSWLLLPHDDRGGIGDVAPLSGLYLALTEQQRVHVQLVEFPPPAAAIKELVGMCDGVITGRMHLAIAALGGGVPVMALAYQAKFAGLMQWFHLPDWLLLDPVKVSDETILWPCVQRFVAERALLRDAVQAQLPYVKRAAHANFEQ
jgi:polysaccharide pyruvyl transferase WcaK-like protein